MSTQEKNVSPLTDNELDALLDTTAIVKEKSLTSVRINPVTLDEVRQAVENYGNLLTAQEGFKATKEYIPAFTFGTDCSLKTLSQVMLRAFINAEVWPKDTDGKYLGIVKARGTVAGKLFNRIYSLVSANGIASPVFVNGEEKLLIKLFKKKERDELLAIYIQLFEVEQDVAEKAIKEYTPLQRYQLYVDYLAATADQATGDNE